MKIIIAPTEDQTDEKYPYTTVTIERPGEGGDIFDTLELVHTALVAWGYSAKLVTQSMKRFEP